MCRRICRHSCCRRPSRQPGQGARCSAARREDDRRRRDRYAEGSHSRRRSESARRRRGLREGQARPDERARHRQATDSRTKGETRGAVLEDGRIIRLPPHEAERFSDLLAKGARISAAGEGATTSFGTVVEAREIGASADTMKPVGPKKPKHGPDHKELKHDGKKHGPKHAHA
jgi:hypothetical protein